MTSKIVQRPYSVVPFPDGTLFSSNTIKINKKIFDLNDIREDYDHKGTYIVSASSYAGCDDGAIKCDNDHQPYHVFNGGKTGSWKTNYSGNKYIFKPKLNDYYKDPYLVLGPEGGLTQTVSSIYQGGGSAKTKYTTIVGKTAYNGEWIQIQVPDTSPVYLFRYSILTPDSGDKNICTYPKSFVLVGSKDGNTWNYIDLKNLSLNDAPNTSNRTPIVNNINSQDYYFYYRFIILEMFPNNSILEIDQINLYAFTSPIPNKNAVTESFVGMNSFSNYNISTILNEDIEHETPIKNNTQIENKNSVISVESVFSAFLFITLFGLIYNKISRK